MRVRARAHTHTHTHTHTHKQEKARLDLDRESDKVHCEAFALRIFGNADRVDRMGKADANTSKAFYAASIFFDVSSRAGAKSVFSTLRVPVGA